MTIQVSDLLSDVRGDLMDSGAGRWVDARMLQLVNSAQLMVVMARPDANAIYQAVQLIQGTKQALPTGGLRFLDAIRNMGSGGATAGNAVRVSERSAMDAAVPGWHAAASSTTVTDVFFDNRFPRSYWVYPQIPAAPQVWLEIGFSKAPTKITDPAAGTLEIEDIYYEAVRMWMLHRAYSQNQQSQVARQRAGEYERSFYAALGLKGPLDAALSPNAQGEGVGSGNA